MNIGGARRITVSRDKATGKNVTSFNRRTTSAGSSFQDPCCIGLLALSAMVLTLVMTTSGVSAVVASTPSNRDRGSPSTTWAASMGGF